MLNPKIRTFVFASFIGLSATHAHAGWGEKIAGLFWTTKAQRMTAVGNLIQDIEKSTIGQRVVYYNHLPESEVVSKVKGIETRILAREASSIGGGHRAFDIQFQLEKILEEMGVPRSVRTPQDELKYRPITSPVRHTVFADEYAPPGKAFIVGHEVTNPTKDLAKEFAEQLIARSVVGGDDLAQSRMEIYFMLFMRVNPEPHEYKAFAAKIDEIEKLMGKSPLNDKALAALQQSVKPIDAIEEANRTLAQMRKRLDGSRTSPGVQISDARGAKPVEGPGSVVSQTGSVGTAKQ